MPRARAHRALVLLLAVATVACAPMALTSPATYTSEISETVGEAQRFMNAYANDLAAGDRAAIARRYARGGAWFLGHGQKEFESYARIEARYAGPEWTPPRSFEWRDLSIEPAGRDAVVVAGLGLWEPADGRPIVTLSYTALLIREDGELRIRLEDESTPRRP